MKNSEYWAERFIQFNEAMFTRSEAAVRDLESEYKKASRDIEKSIEIWLRRIASNNSVTMTEAKKMLDARELEEFRWDVFEYIEKGRANAINGRWMKQLENASARVHINRYEAMLLQIRHNLEMLADNQNKSMMELNADLFTQGYYQTVYEVQKGFEVGTAFSTLKPEMVATVASKPWALDGKNFSDRIWENKERLINDLQSHLTQGFIRGDAPDKAIKQISDRLNVSKHQAGRLVMTEAAYFGSEGQRRAFNELGVEKYEIVATLDGRTSDICRGLDGKILAMKDYQAGVTAPPFHPWCRTVTAPYFEDNYTERAARGADGKVYHIDGNMKYDEWYNKYVKTSQLPKSRKLTDSKVAVQHRYMTEDGRMSFIPKNAGIKDVTVIFGSGVSGEIRDVERLIKTYGGTKADWIKCAGIVESDAFKFDIHWYQKEDGEHVEEKIAKKVRK